jgi:hypothetical protein
LGERLLCKQEVIGSIPFTSTNLRCAAAEVGVLRSTTCVGGRSGIAQLRLAGQRERLRRIGELKLPAGGCLPAVLFEIVKRE